MGKEFFSRIGNSVALVTLAFVLSACAAVKGSQDPITSDDLGKSVCPSETDVSTFDSNPAVGRGVYRDNVISKCIAAIDTKYEKFKNDLQSQTATTNLAVDILALGLTAASSATTGDAARDLAIGSTAALGTGAAINRDVFYQQTLPAVEAAMDDARTQIQIRIVKSQMADKSAANYTLASARSDINAYEAAGNINTAIRQLTTTANQKASNSQDILQTTKVAYQAVVLDTPTYQREKALTDDIRAFANAKNTATLNMIATSLDLSLNANLTVERNAILAEIDKRVTSVDVADPKAAMDKLSALLKTYTGKDY